MESRQDDRVSLVYYLKVFDGLSSRLLGHVVNISEKGLQLVSCDFLEPNEDYRLRVRLPPFMQDQSEIILDGTSRWCRKDENSDCFLVGFQTGSVEPGNRRVVLNLMDALGRRETEN